MKPFLILETGVPIPSLRRHGSFGLWIRVAAGLHERLLGVLPDVPRRVLFPYPIALVFMLGLPRLLYRLWKDYRQRTTNPRVLLRGATAFGRGIDHMTAGRRQRDGVAACGVGTGDAAFDIGPETVKTFAELLESRGVRREGGSPNTKV